MFDLFSNLDIEKATEKVRQDSNASIEEFFEEQNRFSTAGKVDLPDEPGNNILNNFLKGAIMKTPQRVETFEEFFDRRKPGLHFLNDFFRGFTDTALGRETRTVRDDLFKEFQVEQRAQLAEKQLIEQNKQSAIRLAVQQKLEAQREKARLHRDEILNDMKKDLAEMRQEQVLVRDEKKAEARMNELERRGEIQKDIVGFRADLQLDLERTKFDNRDKLAESAFERAQKLVRLRATLSPKDKTFVDSEIVETWTDLAEHGLLDRAELIKSKLPAPILSKVLKNVTDRDIFLFPTTKERQDFNKRRSVLLLVGDINNELMQLEGLFEGTGPEARVRGAIERAKAAVGLNEKLQAILQRIDSLGPTLAKASGDAGNIAFQEQVKAIKGYITDGGKTKLEGEKLFEGAMATVLSTIVPTFESMQTFKRPQDNPDYTTTIRQVVIDARAQKRDPIQYLKELMKQGTNIIPSGI